MYISGGSNVYPREVEEVLLTHPAWPRWRCWACPTPSGARSAWLWWCAAQKP
jgi:acyl-CoA synthetase (AMP-forming)/AMP-acid ligase II